MSCFTTAINQTHLSPPKHFESDFSAASRFRLFKKKKKKLLFFHTTCCAAAVQVKRQNRQNNQRILQMFTSASTWLQSPACKLFPASPELLRRSRVTQTRMEELGDQLCLHILPLSLKAIRIMRRSSFSVSVSCE